MCQGKLNFFSEAPILNIRYIHIIQEFLYVNLVFGDLCIFS